MQYIQEFRRKNEIMSDVTLSILVFDHAAMVKIKINSKQQWGRKWRACLLLKSFACYVSHDENADLLGSKVFRCYAWGFLT